MGAILVGTVEESLSGLFVGECLIVGLEGSFRFFFLGEKRVLGDPPAKNESICVCLLLELQGVFPLVGVLVGVCWADFGGFSDSEVCDDGGGVSGMERSSSCELEETLALNLDALE